MLKHSMFVATALVAVLCALVLANRPELSYAALAQSGGSQPGVGKITQLTDDNFTEVALKSETPVVVDVYADWCGPCGSYAPTFAAVAGDYGDKVKFAKANTDKTPKINRTFAVRSIPTTVVVLKNAGKPVYFKITGVLSKAELKKFIDSAIAKPADGTPLPPLN